MIYQYRATKFCPESLYPNYQELEGAYGESLADWRVNRTATHRKNGINYIIPSGQCTQGLVERHGSGEVDRPWYDEEGEIDLVKAQAGLDAVVLYTGSESVTGDTILVVLSPLEDEISAVEAIAMLGLEAIPESAPTE